MIGVLRVLRNELSELLRSWSVLTLVLILPSVMLLFVGQLEVRSNPVNMLIAGVPEGDVRGSEHILGGIIRLMQELSAVEVELAVELVDDPRTFLLNSDHDVVLQVIDPDDPHNWFLHSATTNPHRFAEINAITRFSWFGEFGQALVRLPPQADFEGAELVLAAGALMRRMDYFPAVGNRDVRLIPQTIALILCLIPFVIGSSSLLREHANRTLHVLLAAPGINAIRLFAGKCLLPLIVGLCNFWIMLLLTESIYGLQVKPGITAATVLLVPALLAATFIALTVSAVVRTQTQALLSAAVYFLFLLLISGFLYPVESGSNLVQLLSAASPLTYLRPVLERWIFGAGIDWDRIDEALTPLCLQALAYGSLAWWAFARLRKQL